MRIDAHTVVRVIAAAFAAAMSELQRSRVCWENATQVDRHQLIGIVVLSELVFRKQSLHQVVVCVESFVTHDLKESKRLREDKQLVIPGPPVAI